MPSTGDTRSNPDSAGFSKEEREAMRERARESKANKLDGTAALLAKVAEMPQPDRGMAERIHALVTAAAPGLAPKTWYGMPAYANAEGQVVCFFQPASKFGARYSTFGFNGPAKLDEGAMWATSFALTELTADAEARITELVKKAVA